MPKVNVNMANSEPVEPLLILKTTSVAIGKKTKAAMARLIACQDA